MFAFKKLVAPFVIPPGLFVLILLAAAVVQLRRRRRASGLFCLFVGLMIWAAATIPAADWLAAGLEKGQAIEPRPQGDVIVMLGGAVYPGVRDMSGSGAPGPGTMERLVTTARLQRRLGVPIIVSGGAVTPGGASSAAIGKRFLADLGIPAEMIITEERSRDTFDNAQYTHEICRLKGFRRPLLVTTGLHMPRALFCFARAGLKVAPYPCGLVAWENRPVHWTHYLPTAANLELTAAALHERLGLLYYRLRY